MKSRIDSPLPGSATRRTATVTISAPDSSMAWRMTSLDEYFPVPTMSRELKSLPPSTRFVSYISLPSAHFTARLAPLAAPRLGRRSPRTAAHGSHDFELVPFRKLHGSVLALRRDLAIHRHRGVLALDIEEYEQRVDGDAGLHVHRLAVDRDVHKRKRPLPHRGCGRSLPSCSLRWDYPDQVRGVPGRTRFSGILPPRRTRS